MRKERKGYGYVSTCGAIFFYTARSNLMNEKKYQIWGETSETFPHFPHPVKNPVFTSSYSAESTFMPPKGSFRQRLHRAQKKPEGVNQRAGYKLIVVSVRLYRVELCTVLVLRDVDFESRLAQGLQVVCESLGELPG